MEKAEGSIGKVILIGGSAGSLDVLLKILPAIHPAFKQAIVIVLHRKFSNDNILTDLLSVKTKLKVREVEEKDIILPGYIYIAPGDYHLLFEKDLSFSLDDSEKVNFSRPSIDVAFQSAANALGSNLICILLSGANADGTEGCKYVKGKGGITVAQLPRSAEVAYMPSQAIASNVVDYVLDIDGIVSFINQL